MGDWIWVLITAAITFLGLAFINVTTAEDSAQLAMGIAQSESISQHSKTDQSPADNSSLATSHLSSSDSNLLAANERSAAVGFSSKQSSQSFVPNNPLPLAIAIVVLIIVLFRLWHSLRMSRTGAPSASS